MTLNFLENVAVMHDLHLIHTDLKPENVLLVTPDYVKVPDYKVWFSATFCVALVNFAAYVNFVFYVVLLYLT